MPVEWFFDSMRARGATPALVSRGRSVTYPELIAAIDAWTTRLDALRIAPGRVVAIEGDFAPEPCALFLALLRRQAILVPLATAIAANRDEFLATAEVEDVFTFSGGQSGLHAATGVTATHPLIRGLRDGDTPRPGLVLFSSGSTGKSKATLMDMGALLEKFRVPRHRLVTLSFLLFDHIGGVNTLLYTLANGGTLVTTQSRAPEDVCRLIEAHGVELLPTTPTFLNLLLLSEAHRTHDLSSLRLITYGTEVMTDTTLERVHEAFPGVRLQQTYGMTEFGILRSRSRDSGSAWVKVGGENVETRVVDGTLRVRAQSAMVGYLNAPNPIDADGWFDTGDEVDVDGDYVRFRGRRSELINVGGTKVHPAEVESVLLQMDNVEDAVVFGEPNPITGRAVAARIRLRQPEELRALRRRIRTFCRDRLAPYKVPVRIELADSPLFSERFKKIRPR